MARRSPMNERYQKNTAPAGKTRRSAASAKPKRSSAAAPVKKASKAPARPTNPMLVSPPTREFRFWRRVWWAMLIASAAATFGSLAVREWMQAPELANILLIAGYVGIFAALALDWLKIRKMRTEWVRLQESGAVPTSENDGNTTS